MSHFRNLKKSEQEEISLWSAKQIFDHAYEMGLDKGYDNGIEDGRIEAEMMRDF